jgi:hypothetical protein
MVILLRNTNLANFTMFAPRRFDEAACSTDLARVEENVVIWILSHVLPVALLRDDRGLGPHGFVGEEGRRGYEYHYNRAVEIA